MALHGAGIASSKPLQPAAYVPYSKARENINNRRRRRKASEMKFVKKRPYQERRNGVISCSQKYEEMLWRNLVTVAERLEENAFGSRRKLAAMASLVKAS